MQNKNKSINLFTQMDGNQQDDCKILITLQVIFQLIHNRNEDKIEIQTKTTSWINSMEFCHYNYFLRKYHF